MKIARISREATSVSAPLFAIGQSAIQDMVTALV